MKNKVFKCKNCVIGTYFHSASESVPLHEDWIMDGLGSLCPPRLFNYCPECGTKVDKKYELRINKEEKLRLVRFNKRFKQMDKCKKGKHVLEEGLCIACFKRA